MRDRTDDFILVCRRMQALMREPASVASSPAQDRLDDVIHRLSQRIVTRQIA